MTAGCFFIYSDIDILLKKSNGFHAVNDLRKRLLKIYIIHNLFSFHRRLPYHAELSLSHQFCSRILYLSEDLMEFCIVSSDAVKDLTFLWNTVEKHTDLDRFFLRVSHNLLQMPCYASHHCSRQKKTDAGNCDNRYFCNRSFEDIGSLQLFLLQSFRLPDALPVHYNIHYH